MQAWQPTAPAKGTAAVGPGTAQPIYIFQPLRSLAGGCTCSTTCTVSGSICCPMPVPQPAAAGGQSGFNGGYLRRYVWESDAGGKFAISEDTTGEPLGRGTQIKIFLKVNP